MVVVDMDRTPAVPLGADVVGAGTGVPGPEGAGSGTGWPPPPSGRPTAGWRPLGGGDLLDRLRVTGRRRPDADPELADRLRCAVERGLSSGDTSGCGRSGEPAPSVPAQPRSVPALVVTKERLTRALACEVHRTVTGPGGGDPTIAMAVGALVDVLFRQLVTVGSIDDPMADGMAALTVDGRQDPLTAWIERLAPGDRAELRVEVERQVHALRRRWPRLDPGWLPRTQESLRTRLAGGAVELATRVDLAIGRPAVHEASVALVEVKSGARWQQHRADLHFSALIETLRSSVPPFVVATYYTRTGELDVDPVTEELLSAAARRTVVGTRVLIDRARGIDGPAPTGFCATCAALPDLGDHWYPDPDGRRATAGSPR